MALFTEDSDSDSIATNTTADSEHSEDHSFKYEGILAEERDPESGQRHYLVKWEGYPLHRCTWETRDQFGDDTAIDQWKAKKRAASRGGIPLFDVTEYEAAQEDALAEKESKARRRLAKRKRRGEISRSQSPVKPPNAARAASIKMSAASPTVKKKGLAQNVVKSTQTKPAPTVTARTSPTGARSTQPAKKSAPSAPLIGSDVPELKRRPRAHVSHETPKDSTAPKFRNLATQNRYQNYSKNEPVPDVNALVMVDLKTGKPLANLTKAPSPKQPANTAPESNTSNAVERRPPEPIGRRPSEPAERRSPQAQAIGASGTSSVAQEQAAANRTVQPLRGANEANVEQRRKSTIVSEQERRSAREPPKLKAPDEPQTLSRSRPTEIHGAYGRRTPPPSDRRQRIPSPPLPAIVLPQIQPSTSSGPPKRMVCKFWQKGICRNTSDACPFAHTYISAQDPSKRFTCYFWKNGNGCYKSEEQCDFAHHDTGITAPSPKNQTCFFWFNGNSCSKSAEACKMAHYHTEFVAHPPPMYVRKPGEFSGYSGPVDTIPEAANDRPVTGVAHTSGAPPSLPLEGGSGQVHVAHHLAESDNAMDLDGAVPPDIQAPEAYAPDPEPQPPARRIQDDLELARQSIRDLDPSTFLSKNGKPIENVYVLMPPDREGERSLLVDFFRGFNCKTYDSSNPQHWRLFRDLSTTSLVVIHPTETFRGTIPKFAGFLWRIKGWVFSMGVYEEWDDLDRPRRTYKAKRVFPHGGIIFITDDVFTYYPDKATEIIESFHKKAKAKPKGGETTKIGARPGVRDWLADLIEKMMKDGVEKSVVEKYVNCFEAICDLCPPEDYDAFEMQRGHMVPRDDALLWSAAEHDLPSFQGLWEKDEAAATAMMADFFAGTAFERMADFQRFCFIYQRPDQAGFDDGLTASQQSAAELMDPKGWMRKYNHVEVLTPDAWLRMASKRTKMEQSAR